MNKGVKIAGYTLQDHMRHKSVYVLLGISIFIYIDDSRVL